MRAADRGDHIYERVLLRLFKTPFLSLIISSIYFLFRKIYNFREFPQVVADTHHLREIVGVFH